MALWTSEDAVRATGGRSTRDWQAQGVSIDTRSLKPGDLFVALKDIRDGHEFVAQALEKGAAAALVSHVPDGLPKDAPLLLVPDVLPALEALGRAARARTKAKVIGITGSVGKTSTKEMLRRVLTRQGRVHAAERSFNNHWGVPLTLARMPGDVDFAIIEIGMSAPGEISPLARMSGLDVAMITTVAAAHMQSFDGIEAIAVEKAAIFDGLLAGGHAVINSDLTTSSLLIDKARQAQAAITRFGRSEDAEFQLLDVRLAHDVTVISARVDGQEILFKIATPGQHFAMNGLGVLAVVAALGGDIALAATDLATWQPPEGRGTHETVQLDPVRTEMCLDLIDDAFNANPVSMSGALDMLAALTPRDGIGRLKRGRRIAILGDMLELGPDEAAQHAALAEHSAMADITLVHCVGPRMQALWAALPADKQGQWADSADALAAKVHSLVDAGDVVLVKGSKGSLVSHIVTAIRNLGHPALSNH